MISVEEGVGGGMLRSVAGYEYLAECGDQYVLL